MEEITLFVLSINSKRNLLPSPSFGFEYIRTLGDKFRAGYSIHWMPSLFYLLCLVCFFLNFHPLFQVQMDKSGGTPSHYIIPFNILFLMPNDIPVLQYSIKTL